MNDADTTTSPSWSWQMDKFKTSWGYVFFYSFVIIIFT